MKLNASGKKSPDEFGTDSQTLPPGIYRVRLVGAYENENKLPGKVKLTFKVLKGTIPGMEGKEHTEFFATTEKALPRLDKLAMVLDLLEPGSDEDVEVDFQNAVGKECVIETEAHEYEGRKSNRIVYMNMWKLDHKKVPEMLRGKIASEAAEQSELEPPLKKKKPAKAEEEDEFDDI